ncbi:MAG: M24 family metallopeptidase [Acidobacteriota bacterium]
MKEEVEEKIERLMRLMTHEGLSGVLLNAQHNFAWLTAGGRNGIDQSREAGAGSLLVCADGRRFVLANKIELSRLMSEELTGQGYEPVEYPWEEEKGNPGLVADLAGSLIKNSKLGSDLSLGKSVAVVEGAIARARSQLTDSEVERFRLLGRDAAMAIGNLARALTPGLTEREVARMAADALAGIGAYSPVTLVAADERIRRFRHPVPTDLRWEKTLMIVVCARRQGLIASLTRLVCYGAIPEELSRRTELTAGVNGKIFTSTKPGISGSDIFSVAAQAYRDAGFPGEELLHHQGGATGYRTRDWVAHPQCTEQVQVDQAFAWNPSITGTKVEETCIAFADGLEIITATPDWPAIPVEVSGRAYHLPGILSL